MSNPTNNHTSNPYNLVTPYTNERRQLNEEKKTEEKKTSDQSITSATNAIASVRIGNLQQQIPNPTNTIAAARVSSLQPQVPRGANAIDSLDVSSSRPPIIPLTFTFVRGPDARGAQNSQSPDTLLPPQNSSNQQAKAQGKDPNKPSSFNTLPNEILQTILRFSGEPIETLKTINKELNNQTNETMGGFWLEKFENPEILNANPDIQKHINELRVSVGADRWNALPPQEKLRQLYCKMVAYVRDIDPIRLQRLQIQNRILDFSTYQKFTRIATINLRFLAQAMKTAMERAVPQGLPSIADLTSSQLQDFIQNPSSIAHTRWLHINGVVMTALPPDIERLTNLEVLSVANTPMTALRDHLHLPKLYTLNLDHTQISTLPKTIRLPRLHELSLSNTLISVWPNDLNLPNLESLSLSDTPMTTFPHNLPKLTNLDLENSQIETLPEEFQLPELSTLFLSGTPLVQTEEGKELALKWGIRHGVEVIF